MLIRSSLLTASSEEPITLEEIKIHLRIDIGETAEDDLLMGLLRASRERVEIITGRKLMPQTWYAYFSDFPWRDYFELPYAPIRSIPSSGLYYTDSTGGSTTFSSTKWSSDIVSVPGRLVLDYNEDWPSNTLAANNPIRIEFSCGYAGSTSVPDTIKAAMKLMVGHWYENREDSMITSIQPIPLGVKALLAPYKIFYTGEKNEGWVAKAYS
jgi:uncharacterized phiE125 gp8 family phage protein